MSTTEIRGRSGNAADRRIGAWLFAVCCLPLLAWAEPLSIRVEPPGSEKRAVGNPRWDVFLEGDIDAGAAERVAQELAQIGGDGADVYLASPGGSLMDGVRIGTLLRRLGATTTVGKRGTRSSQLEPGTCLSACSMAFLGGLYRYVPKGSVLGVHRVAATVHTERDFDAGQIVAARVAGYIRDMGVDARLFDRMANAGTDQIYVPGAAELRALHIVNDGREPAEWRSELSADGPSLTATQQTASGAGRAVFTCGNGAVVFHSSYQAGSNAAPIASGQWTHALLIDDVALPLDAPSSIEDADGILNATFDLSPEQARRIAAASSVGHSMQGDRSDPAAMGYRIDIDAAAAKKLQGFMASCAVSR